MSAKATTAHTGRAADSPKMQGIRVVAVSDTHVSLNGLRLVCFLTRNPQPSTLKSAPSTVVRAEHESALRSMPHLAVVDAEAYQAQLEAKEERVRKLFSDFELPQISSFASPTQHYRMRAEFSVWHQGEDCYYVMFDKAAAAAATARAEAEEPLAPESDDPAGLAHAHQPHVNGKAPELPAAGGASPPAAATEADQNGAGSAEQGGKPSSGSQELTKSQRRKAKKRKAPAPEGTSKRPLQRVRVDDFPVGSVLMNELMTAVMAFVKQHTTLRSKLFQVNLHTTLNGQALVSLLYHRKLDDAWKEDAVKLRQNLVNSCPSLKGLEPGLMGRSRGEKILMGEDFVTEKLTVEDGRSFTYRQPEGGFAQPNAVMCQHMLSWALDATSGLEDDLLELYCGNGNFTIPLASNFRKVVATELAKVSVAAAVANLEANAVSNVHMGRLSSEEFVQAWRGERVFARLQGLDLSEFKLRTLLVDPPRAGLDAVTVQLLAEFDNIVYVSCNPTTLHENLQRIRDTHEIKRFALFDQFPYTEHIECGVLLQRRKAGAA
ncbi:hypothetical protein WJX73_006750 [Symbiochloris irregularis]|uniref:Uncharacterized protein n=1 Tax=Symbiochloris irregularis TaxID=706552 RepID=A0AAW1PK11_9CHLO